MLRRFLLIYALAVGAVAAVDLLVGDELSIRTYGAVLVGLALVTVLPLSNTTATPAHTPSARTMTFCPRRGRGRRLGVGGRV